jgi:GH15 family glucan-1,4-alpha-glucosidase
MESAVPRTATELVTASLNVIREGQTPSGAFLASPSFPTYRYCWFRDGAFIAQALDLWGDHLRSEHFYDWGVSTVLRNRGAVERVLAGPPNVVPAAHLHTRYEPDSTPSQDDWPTFQLDGFGTFLWGMVEHLRLTQKQMPAEWNEAAGLVVKYLAHLWRAPNFDCWEEFADKIHISTLCALHGGAAAIGEHLGTSEACSLADETERFVRQEASTTGYLPKFVGSNAVDASLLWAGIPFALLNIDDPLMEATVNKIESDLVGPSGGVHRYAADTYYGGGAWILLTALLGEYWLRRGDHDRPFQILEWIESHANGAGELPEQVPVDLIDVDKYDVWVKRWGPNACPLLWSHAGYLRLKNAIAQ